jgi:hypothetical protein
MKNAMTMRNAVRAVVVLLGLALAACGNQDAFVAGSTNSTTGTTTSAASLMLLTSSTQVGSSSSSSVTLTAMIKDANNNLISGVPVTFSATSGALAVSQPTTDGSGQALATLSPGGDFSNRTITVTAAAGNLNQTVNVAVTGTSISISGESSATLGAPVVLTISVKDSDGNPIVNSTVSMSSALGNTLSASTLTTNSAGQVSLTVTPATAGSDTITVSAEGATASHTLVVSSDQFQFTAPASGASINIGACAAASVAWKQNGTAVAGQAVSFSATRGTLYSDSGCSVAATSATTNGSGVATLYISSSNAGPSTLTAFVSGGPTTGRSVEFVATTPATIDLQANPATIGPNDGSKTQQQQSTITAVVRDAANNLVANQVVRFSIVQDNSGGTLTSSTATTDSLGRASTSYISSAATTAQNGIQIRAEMKDNPSVNNTVSLTVAQSALFIRLGTGNVIGKIGDTLYDKKYTVIVTDASGNAASNVKVSLAVNPVYYAKGTYNPSADGSKWELAQSIQCPSEDINQNGILDSGEDLNGNDQLTPGNVASVPATVTTGADGTFEFDVIYPMEYGNWVRVRLQASTSVAGTESIDQVNFWLPVAADDLSSTNKAPPGMPSPFGVTADCTTTD